MIYIYTFAYNAENTIEKTIESVLAQTKKEFCYYLMDNGSADRTGEIIRDYAERDSRIVPFYNRVNRAYDENQEFWNLTCTLQDEDYFVALDADDYYEPTFLEEILTFMKEENLDVAACGTEFFDAETGEVLARRVLLQSLVCRDSVSYDMFFRFIHWNLRQVWGKVYSGKVARRLFGVKLPQWWIGHYGADTASVITCLKYADSIGVYAKVLHHYRMSRGSVSYQWEEGREKSDLILHEKTCALLLNKAGYLSNENLVFLCGVYLNAVKDTLEVLGRAQMIASKKWRIMNAIFTEQITLLALKMDLSSFANGKSLQELIISYKREYLQWILSITQQITEEDMSVIESFLRSFSPVFESLFTTEYLYEMLKFVPEVILDLTEENYVCALGKVELLLGAGTKKRELIQLAQNLAALTSNEEKYVAYSKMYIHDLILCKEIDVARIEINEWLQVVPDDEDFLKWKELL